MMRPTLLLPCLLLLASPAARVDAADAHVGVHPERGEMVLLRDVNARLAYRPAPPGIALIVDPTPNREIDSALGTGEMSDAKTVASWQGLWDARTGSRPVSLGQSTPLSATAIRSRALSSFPAARAHRSPFR